MGKQKRKKTSKAAKEAAKEASKEQQLFRFNLASGDGPISTLYESAYRGKIVRENEWDAHVAAMARPLNVTFRADFSSMAGRLVTSQMMSLVGEQGVIREAAAGGMEDAMSLDFDKTALRTQASLDGLSDVLKREMVLGSISRQELVSMLPCHLAGVEPKHHVLELCACPGSKTRQILAMMRRGRPVLVADDGEGATEDADDGQGGFGRRSDDAGLLVANDSDAMRVQSLREQFSRSVGGADPSLLLTNDRGDDICKTFLGMGKGPTGGESGEKGPSFDRVFVDVPCTGDGTFRKAPELWRTWNAERATKLRPLQVQLLTAALSVVKPGGVVAYSTCSLNPVENEEVVAEVLRRANGSGLELMDAHAAAHAQGCRLRLRPGLTLAQCRDGVDAPVAASGRVGSAKGAKKSKSGKAAGGAGGKASPAASVSAPKRKRVHSLEQIKLEAIEAGEPAEPRSMDEIMQSLSQLREQEKTTDMASDDEAVAMPGFASEDEDEIEDESEHRVDEDAEQDGGEQEDEDVGIGGEPQLELCVRVAPHDNDTGGFFVALIKKTGDVKFDHGSKGGGGKSRAVSADAAFQVLREVGFEPARPTKDMVGLSSSSSLSAASLPAVSAPPRRLKNDEMAAIQNAVGLEWSKKNVLVYDDAEGSSSVRLVTGALRQMLPLLAPAQVVASGVEVLRIAREVTETVQQIGEGEEGDAGEARMDVEGVEKVELSVSVSSTGAPLLLSHVPPKHRCELRLEDFSSIAEAALEALASFEVGPATLVELPLQDLDLENDLPGLLEIALEDRLDDGEDSDGDESVDAAFEVLVHSSGVVQLAGGSGVDEEAGEEGYEGKGGDDRAAPQGKKRMSKAERKRQKKKQKTAGQDEVLSSSTPAASSAPLPSTTSATKGTARCSPFVVAVSIRRGQLVSFRAPSVSYLESITDLSG